MSFSTVETINTINKYKQIVGSRLVYINDPVNLNSADEGVEFVEGLLANTSGAEIKFQDYNEMLKFINSIDYLDRVFKMPKIGATQDECIEYINNLRKDSVLNKKIAEMEKGAINAYNKNPGFNSKLPDIKVIWTNESLVTDYNEWLKKEKQIYIPGDYQYQANKITSKYMTFVGSLPKDKQLQTKAFLDNLNFAETLFKTDKELNNKLILSLINKLDIKSKRYGQNIFFSIIDLDPYEYAAVSKMAYWLDVPLNEMFTINDQMVGQGLNQILSGQLAKQKAQQAYDKEVMLEEGKKEKEKKDKEKEKEDAKAAPKPSDLDDIRHIVDDFTKQSKELNNIYGELHNLKNPPDIAALSDIEKRADKVSSTLENVEKSANSFINENL